MRRSPPTATESGWSHFLYFLGLAFDLGTFVHQACPFKARNKQENASFSLISVMCDLIEKYSLLNKLQRLKIMSSSFYCGQYIVLLEV